MEGRRGWHHVNGGRIRSIPNQSNGDCLFRALSHQLEGAMLAPQLRELAVNYMTANMEEFRVQLMALGWDMMTTGEIPPNLDDEELPVAVLNALRLPWTWGGAESIAAICRIIRRPIFVYQEGGETLTFYPIDRDEALPALRLLHTQGQDGNRTHYESVLEWQPDQSVLHAPVPEPPVESSVSDNEAALGERDEVVPPPLKVPRIESHQNEDSLPPQPPNGPSSPMQLRPRRPCFSAESFRSSQFSAADSVRDPGDPRRYSICIICGIRVGRHALLCGAFPLCGFCITEWYILHENVCTHCGGEVIGWFRVYNQN